MDEQPPLRVLCGKPASEKITLGEELAAEANAELIREDLWLSKLFPGEISDFKII